MIAGIILKSPPKRWAFLLLSSYRPVELRMFSTKASFRTSRRWWLLVAVATILALVSDGWSGKPSPLLHQVLLTPVTLVAALLSVALLRQGAGKSSRVAWTVAVAVLGGFEVLSLAMMIEEGQHFRRLGYSSSFFFVLPIFMLALLLGMAIAKRPSGRLVLSGAALLYVCGIVIALLRFPLNYLRSDMLPVITWADGRLLRGQNPYATMRVGVRLYDFPYLPGMLVAYVPAGALHIDPRVITGAYLLGATALLYSLARSDARFAVAATLGVFLLNPFLQYRHDLYLQPHWFLIAWAVWLQRRGHVLGAGFAWGVSCAVYQLSWVLVPFFVLKEMRSGGLLKAVKVAGLVLVGVLVVAGPFLPFAAGHIASNTVGQWNRLPHALADPINLSYWLTYLVPPYKLRLVQAVVLGSLFGFCVLRGRCRSQTDMLRWMSGALALFIALNVLVDGYFYLTVLLLLVMFVCSANEWWAPEVLPTGGALGSES